MESTIQQVKWERRRKLRQLQAAGLQRLSAICSKICHVVDSNEIRSSYTCFRLALSMSPLCGDHRFYDIIGIDPIAITRAMVNDVKADQTERAVVDHTAAGKNSAF